MLQDTPFASKGEGAIYRIASQNSFVGHCAKIYHLPYRDIKRKIRIEYMVANKPQKLRSSDHIICWPVEMIFDKNKKFLGFIMPLAFSESEMLYEIVKPNLPKRLSHTWQKFDRKQNDSIEIRMKVCLNVVIAIHNIHLTGKYVLCDFKPENLLISKSGQVSIIDTDSFQISEHGKVLHAATAFTPEYTPPEKYLAKSLVNGVEQSWDRFSFAIVFYQILFGIHPYACSSNVDELADKIRLGQFVHGQRTSDITRVPPIHQVFDAYPPSVRKLFMLAFDHGHDSPDARPSAEDWGKTLHEILPEAKNMKSNTSVSPAVLSNPPASRTGITILRPRVQADSRIFLYAFICVCAMLLLVVFYRTFAPTKTVLVNKNESIEVPPVIFSGFTVNKVGLDFIDRNLLPLKPQKQTIGRETVKYIQPVINITGNTNRPNVQEAFIKITGPDGKVFAVKRNTFTEYTYSQKIELHGFESDEIKLKSIDINCPKCSTGIYEVEIFIGERQVGTLRYQIK